MKLMVDFCQGYVKASDLGETLGHHQTCGSLRKNHQRADISSALKDKVISFQKRIKLYLREALCINSGYDSVDCVSGFSATNAGRLEGANPLKLDRLFAAAASQPSGHG